MNNFNNYVADPSGSWICQQFDFLMTDDKNTKLQNVLIVKRKSESKKPL